MRLWEQGKRKLNPFLKDAIIKYPQSKGGLGLSKSPVQKPKTRHDYQAESDRGLNELYGYLYCAIVSGILCGTPLVGSALFLSGQTARMFLNLTFAKRAPLISRPLRLTGLALSVTGALCAPALLLLLPFSGGESALWLMFGLVTLVLLRGWLSDKLLRYCARRGLSPAQSGLRAAELILLMSAAAFILLYSAANPRDALVCGLGFVFLSAIDTLMRHAEIKKVPYLPDQAPLKPEQLRILSGANACRVYIGLLICVTCALQVTQIVLFTYLTRRSDAYLTMILAAILLAYLSDRLARRLMRPGRKGMGMDPVKLLLLGLTLWLLSLFSFALRLNRPESIWILLSLCLCGLANVLTLRAFDALSQRVDELPRFLMPEFGDGKRTWQTTLYWISHLSALSGQIIALIGLSALAFLNRGSFSPELKPILLIPSFLLVGAALLFALRFPLGKVQEENLQRFLMLKENGETNAPLQKKLESVILIASPRRYGFKLFLSFLRLLMPTRLLGFDEIRLTPGVSTIFACNHGEFWGPLIGNLYLPYPYRPWSINEVVQKDVIADYIYRFTFSRQKWLPKRLQMPFSRFCAPILAWCTHSIESIPVFRDQPRALIKTFKLTAEAMIAGDNILLYPENPNDPSLPHPGYRWDGVGPFFTGYTLAAEIYYRETGLCAQFIPLFADKQRRTLSAGQGIVFDPENGPIEEGKRISEHLRQEMLRLAQMEDTPLSDQQKEGR